MPFLVCGLITCNSISLQSDDFECESIDILKILHIQLLLYIHAYLSKWRNSILLNVNISFTSHSLLPIEKLILAHILRTCRYNAKSIHFASTRISFNIFNLMCVCAYVCAQCVTSDARSEEIKSGISISFLSTFVLHINLIVIIHSPKWNEEKNCIYLASKNNNLMDVLLHSYVMCCSFNMLHL